VADRGRRRGDRPPPPIAPATTSADHNKKLLAPLEVKPGGEAVPENRRG